jgi:RNA polymerase sigma factor (sigma-70 family)
MADIRELVERASLGDMDALNELISRFQGMAVGYAWSLTGDWHLAQDLAQEAFIQAVRGIAGLKNPAAFPLWFKTILRFTCIRRLRRRNPAHVGLEEAEGRSAGQTPEDGAVSCETRNAVRASINRLPEEDRSILALYYFEELPHRQIAAFLGIDEYRVNNRLHALRQKLKASRRWPPRH